MQRLLTSFLDLLFPQCCEVCGQSLVTGEHLICLSCRYSLPKTSYWLTANNKAAQLFWGRVVVENVAPFFFYNKRSGYSKLLHKLKYKGRRDIGVELGRWYGGILAKAPLYTSVDAILPVPLHPKRLRKRGYNQSEEICLGMSEAMKVPLLGGVLLRSEYTETQTNKSRMQRWQNVENVFTVALPELLEGRHILLVDDVLTTGSTIESAALELLKTANCKVSVATLAIAVY